MFNVVGPSGGIIGGIISMAIVIPSTEEKMKVTSQFAF